MSEQNSESEKTRNQLDLKQQFQLRDWLHTVEERLKKECPSWRTAAEWATAALKFHVTGTNIETVATATGVRWDKPQRYSGYGKLKPMVEGWVNPLREECAALRKRILDAEQIVLDEATRLGKEVEALKDALRDACLRADEAAREVGKLSVQQSQMESECQRLRIAMTAIADASGITLPASTGIPPRSSRGIAVAGNK